MKNSILLFLFISFSFSGFSQLVFKVNGEEIINGQEFTFNSVGTESNLVVIVTNNNTSEISLKLLFEAVNATEETTDLEFCIGSCYWPESIEAGEIFGPLSIDAGATTGEGDIHFHNHYEGNNIVSYDLKLYDEADEAGSFVQFTYTYDINSGIGSINSEQLLAYPIPANDVLYFTNKTNQTKEYSLFDLSGKNLISGQISEEKSNISISHLPAGMYFLQVSTNGKQSETQKIIIK